MSVVQLLLFTKNEMKSQKNSRYRLREREKIRRKIAVKCSPDDVAVIMTETMAMTPSADAVGRILQQPVISRIRSLSTFRDLLHPVHLLSTHQQTKLHD